MLNNLEKKFSVLNNESIRQKSILKIKKYQSDLKREKLLNDPFYENRKKLKKNIASTKIKKNSFIEDFKKYISDYEELENIAKEKFIDIDFFYKEVEKLENIALEKKQKKKSLAVEFDKRIQKDIKINTKLLFEKWQKDLNNSYDKWALMFEKEKEKLFLDDLISWLKKLQKVSDTLEATNLGDSLLFDFDNGALNEQDLQEILRWADFISSSKNIQKLCDMLGRLKKASKLKKKELAKVTKEIKTFTKVTTSKNEISGLKFGKDIQYALPSELSMIDDEEFSILFDKKFVEGTLLCFDSNVIGEIDIESVSLQEFQKYIEKEEQEKLGPIVICVDTSGSMSGEPENIAKAVTLSIASRAKEKNRECFLINFSTSIELFDFSQKQGISQLVEFLKKSFHGGTDVAPALEYAVKKLQEDKFKNGDLLVISDFQMGSINKDLQEKIKFLKEQKNKFYSLVIGNYTTNQLDIFDKEWLFNLNSNDIIEIDDIARRF
ncbi:VWA domain-containing protein [Sulfurimonas sp. NW15]|uniref:VWA domain-containing protein n=1 Tax=Sulfurimonas sp. NW15 TaxID=2922729 RepID=UPI003DA99912